MKNILPVFGVCPHCGEDLKIIIRKKRKTKPTKIYKNKHLKPWVEPTPRKNAVPQGAISPLRINNIVKAYHYIEWDINSAKITIMGMGDKPAFTLDGVFKKHNGVFPDIKVQYHTFTPGGGQARLYFWVKGKRHIITATLMYAKKVTLKMLSEYHRLIGKEYKLDFHQSGYGYLFKK